MISERSNATPTGVEHHVINNTDHEFVVVEIELR